MSPSRLIAVMLIVLSLAGLGVSVTMMASRLGKRDNHLVFFGKPIADSEFGYRGEHVSIVTVDAPVEAGGGRGTQRTLEIRWRGGVYSTPIVDGMREDDRLPGLLRHSEWLRVLTYAEGARTDAEIAAAVDAGTITPHLIVAMRSPPEGFDAGSWGSVRRREWVYQFVELLPPPPLSPGEARAVSSPEPFKVTRGTYAEIEKLGEPGYRRAEGREADYWQYAAMEQVTPATLFRSKNRNMNDAMASMGWTWPAAGTSIMGLIAGIGVLILGGGAKRAEDSAVG